MPAANLQPFFDPIVFRRITKTDSLRGFTPAEIGNLYLFLVATSHQTSPQDRQPLAGTVGKRLLRGWDYLTARFEAAARLDRAILSPDYWEHFTAQNIRDLFRDELLGERLSDPEGRSALIRDLGRQMLLHSWSSAKDIYDASGGYIDKDETSLLSRLARFRAYRDPVHKKSFFFLALMRNTGLWKYKDPGNLGAPIDYHEVRGHLRIGTVQIQDLEAQHQANERRGNQGSRGHRDPPGCTQRPHAHLRMERSAQSKSASLPFLERFSFMLHAGESALSFLSSQLLAASSICPSGHLSRWNETLSVLKYL